MRALIEIELPGFPLEEFEPIAFRRPCFGELLWNEVENKWELAGNGHLPRPWLILRRRFQWPGFIPRSVRCLTWDGNGTVYAWNVVPFFCASRSRWIHGSGEGYDGGFAIPRDIIDLPFPGGDWKTRVEENPNWGK